MANYFWLLLAGTVFSLNLHAKEISFGYPELNVVPSASEVLKREAAIDEKSGIMRDWQNLAPFAMLSVTALMAPSYLKADLGEGEATANDLTSVATLIGLGGVAAVTLSSMYFKPFKSGSSEVLSMKGKSTRDRLTRERAAEGVIDSGASYYNKLRWVTMSATFLGSVAIMGVTEGLGSGLAAATVVTSILPFIYEHHYSRVERRYEDHKRRIYTPVASFGFTTSLDPQLNFTWTF
jgi:hypothetical protein